MSVWPWPSSGWPSSSSSKATPGGRWNRRTSGSGVPAQSLKTTTFRSWGEVSFFCFWQTRTVPSVPSDQLYHHRFIYKTHFYVYVAPLLMHGFVARLPLLSWNGRAERGFYPAFWWRRLTVIDICISKGIEVALVYNTSMPFLLSYFLISYFLLCYFLQIL